MSGLSYLSLGFGVLRTLSLSSSSGPLSLWLKTSRLSYSRSRSSSTSCVWSTGSESRTWTHHHHIRQTENHQTGISESDWESSLVCAFTRFAFPYMFIWRLWVWLLTGYWGACKRLNQTTFSVRFRYSSCTCAVLWCVSSAFYFLPMCICLLTSHKLVSGGDWIFTKYLPKKPTKSLLCQPYF